MSFSGVGSGVLSGVGSGVGSGEISGAGEVVISGVGVGDTCPLGTTSTIGVASGVGDAVGVSWICPPPLFCWLYKPPRMGPPIKVPIPNFLRENPINRAL